MSGRVNLSVRLAINMQQLNEESVNYTGKNSCCETL